MERESPFDPPLPERDLPGGQPSPLPPAPGAYAPLAGAGCGAPRLALGVLRTAAAAWAAILSV